MKTIATLPLAAFALAVSLAPASADDRQVTIYTGAGGISLPASALAVAQPVRKAATDTVPARKIRVVLASPYRAAN